MLLQSCSVFCGYLSHADTKRNTPYLPLLKRLGVAQRKRSHPTSTHFEDVGPNGRAPERCRAFSANPLSAASWRWAEWPRYGVSPMRNRRSEAERVLEAPVARAARLAQPAHDLSNIDGERCPPPARCLTNVFLIAVLLGQERRPSKSCDILVDLPAARGGAAEEQRRRSTSGTARAATACGVRP